MFTALRDFEKMICTELILNQNLNQIKSRACELNQFVKIGVNTHLEDFSLVRTY